MTLPAPMPVQPAPVQPVAYAAAVIPTAAAMATSPAAGPCADGACPTGPLHRGRVSPFHDSRFGDRCGCSSCQTGTTGLPASAYQGDGAALAAPPGEYLCNGGDLDPTVRVKHDWTVEGLHLGDAVAHFDTVDGRRFVEPTNKVCIYAPRFAAVRKVDGVVLHEGHQHAAGVERPVAAASQEERLPPSTVLQPLQPQRSLAIRSANSFQENARGINLENTQAARGTEAALLPFEDLLLVRRGVFDNTEKPRLSESLQAAVVWSRDQAVQVVLDGKIAVEAAGDLALQGIHVYEVPEGKSRLRIVKIAAKQNAQPGDVIDFTVRFDNVGDQLIGNVTVVDSLIPRLEYIADSQSSSLPATFYLEPNSGESQTLRWEITDPLKVGQGGVLRFRCRVR